MPEPETEKPLRCRRPDASRLMPECLHRETYGLRSFNSRAMIEPRNRSGLLSALIPTPEAPPTSAFLSPPWFRNDREAEAPDR